MKMIRFPSSPAASKVVLALALMLIPLQAFSTITGGSQITLSKPLVVKWRYQTDDILNLTPAVYKDSIYLPLTAGNVVSLGLLGGEIAWRAEIGGEISASPSADQRAVYVASEHVAPSEGDGKERREGKLRALGLQSGVTLWMLPLPSPVSGDMGANETTLFGRTEDGRLLAVNKEDGRLLWSQKGASPFAPGHVLASGRLFAATADGHVLALEQQTGKEVWRLQTGGKNVRVAAVDGQTLYLGSDDNFVFAVSAADGQLLWRYRTAGSIQAIAPTPKGVLVTSQDNFVYSLSAKRGKRNWKRQLAGRVAAPPAVSDDAALFAPLAGDECVVLDLKTGKKLNAVFVGDDNNTSAAPLIAGKTLLLTTRKGLVALGGSS